MDIKENLKEAAAIHAKGVKDAAAAQAVVLKEAAAAQARVVMSDLWHAVRTDRQVQLMLALLIFSLVCWDMPYVSVLLYPFKLIVNMIGQACAVLAARVTGGTVEALVIDPRGAISAFQGGNTFLILNAAALGTSIVGGFLIWWGRTPREARFALRSLGTVMLVLTVFYADASLLPMVVLALSTVAVLYISAKASEKVCHIFLLVLAVQTTLSALLIAVGSLILSAASAEGVAGAMQTATGVPAFIWALFWSIASLAILIFSFWISYRPPQALPQAESASRTESAASANTAEAGAAHTDAQASLADNTTVRQEQSANSKPEAEASTAQDSDSSSDSGSSPLTSAKDGG